MAYTPINKPKEYFDTNLYSGDGGTQTVTGLEFQPDWTWVKSRNTTDGHTLQDVVRGYGSATKLASYSTDEENDSGGATWGGYGYQSAATSDGFTMVAGSTPGQNNKTGNNYASWNWSAAGTAPSKTYTVKVVSDSGNKYRFDDFGTSAITLELSEGGTFRFDQSDSSNSGHPLRFSTTSDGTHNSGTEYTTGVTTNGTPGSSGAYTEITVAASAPTLYYYCSVHSGMGGQANTPTTNSFTNVDGTIQANISPNTTSGFSIVSYTGTGANASIGHGLGVAPAMYIVKNRDAAQEWSCYHQEIGATKYLDLNDTGTATTFNLWQDTAPTSSVFTVVNHARVNSSGNKYIAYCFSEVKGFSKFGSYTGVLSAAGEALGSPFVYTGFKPAMVILKSSSHVENWFLKDAKRDTFNYQTTGLYPNITSADGTGYNNGGVDFYSNGFAINYGTGDIGSSGKEYIYMAFAENPLVTSGGTPATAR